MDINKAMEMAKEAGFDTVAAIDPGKLEFRSEVRDMCAACPGYGLSWGCPPACGTLEEVAARVKPYTSGILVQTICKMEDEYDMAAWGVAGGEHGTRFMELLARFQEITDVYPMGAGGCRRCEELLVSRCALPASGAGLSVHGGQRAAGQRCLPRQRRHLLLRTEHCGFQLLLPVQAGGLRCWGVKLCRDFERHHVITVHRR